jgi:hypothetical protein
MARQVIVRQRDTKTNEVKLIAGATLDGTAAEVVVKVGFSGKLIIITAYVC